jgi:transcription elongation GreA/GreB family factor
MNKTQLHQQLIIHLQAKLISAKAAAKRAHETATSEENIAENKYDTLALEAAYLAQGQSRRVIQCQADIDLCISLSTRQSHKANIGALVVLMNELEETSYFLIAPIAGGTKLVWHQHTVLVITPHSPIGEALLNHQVDDAITFSINNQSQQYNILQII